MEPTSDKNNSLQKQSTVMVKKYVDNPKSYDFDEAIDLTGELKTLVTIVSTCKNVMTTEYTKIEINHNTFFAVKNLTNL